MPVSMCWIRTAPEFYLDKLGFKVNTDAPFWDGMRWLTVSPPDQPELEITLMEVKDRYDV